MNEDFYSKHDLKMSSEQSLKNNKRFQMTQFRRYFFYLFSDNGLYILYDTPTVAMTGHTLENIKNHCTSTAIVFVSIYSLIMDKRWVPNLQLRIYHMHIII